MTTRALVRATAWDNDRIRESLRAMVVSAEGVLGGVPVRLTQEPLLKRGNDGGLRQSLRVAPVAGAVDLGPLAVRTASGTALPVEREPGPGGSVRLLVPAVDSAERLTVSRADAGEGAEGVEVTLTPQRRWTIHLIHHSHLDIGYTDPQGRVLAEHLSFLDSCLELTGQTDDWPEESRFRWCVESLWSFRQWAEARPAEQVDEFVRRVRQGRIELTAMPFNLHSETCSTDELHELLRLSRQVSKRYGVGFTSAMQTDVPGHVVGMIDALSSAGVRYLSVAHNWAGRSVPHLVGGEHLPRLFRWRAPSGRELLVWMTDTPHGLAYMEGPLLGFDTDYRSVDDLLPAYLTSLASNPYPYPGGVFGWAMDRETISREPYPWDVLHLRVQGKFGDNAPPRRIIAETVRRWNETWEYPKLRLSRNEDFFADAESRLDGQIQTFEGDWTDWWVDGVGSGAMPLSLARTAQGEVADAQTLATFAGLLGAAEAADDTEGAAPVYEAVSLFDEHTWGAGDPWTHGHDHGHSGEDQWHWKYGQARRGHDEGRALLNRAGARLGQRLAPPTGVAAAFHVVNTCSFARTEVVELFLAESTVPLERPVEVRDARTGRRLAHQERPQVNDTHRDAGRFLLARVDELPPAGSVRLDVVALAETAEGGDEAGTLKSATGWNPTGGTDREDPATTAARALARPDATVLENEALRVTVDLARACVASIVDKGTGRELVDQDAVVGFNGYLHDSYTTAGAFNHNSSRTTASDRLEHLGSRAVAPPAALIDRQTMAVAEVLVYETRPAGARAVRTTLTLPHGVARLDIVNTVDKDATLGKESAYFAFPFALVEPRVRMEASGGLTGNGLPVVPGSARHMRAVRRWVTLADEELTVAWSTQDAPLVQFGNIALPYAPFPKTLEEDEPATVFSWIHNNLWDTNFPSAQAFDLPFRYSVACAPTASAADLGPRTAAATSRPPHPVRARADASDEAAVATLGFVQLDEPRVRLVGAVTEPDGAVLLRLQSFAESPLTCPLRPLFPVAEAYLASYLGEATEELTPEADGHLAVPVPTLGTVGVLLRPA
ncbi:glycoside hydrolase family 38 N-terminal domain-containing protein [Streptomyces triticirhizae]|uniref:Alpha-mannosidase n=1 Tax=Streptomyces triticirhizae TaxID=2483353 RepID=A0A3M2LMA0_9ACTN|nr:glycoside hydrolase family 38 C-terminal domain-containing protein [Streptomyces triticirhizae]RMI38592.1 alpha-mannosidase [Streptomyces triticirhizae]